MSKRAPAFRQVDSVETESAASKGRPTWRNETEDLRKIVLDCGLVEELKWGKPCFTYQQKNVVIIIPLKDACALSFFKGALLKDPKRILQKIGEAQAGRWIKFTSSREISALRATLRSYIYEAIEVEA